MKKKRDGFVDQAQTYIIPKNISSRLFGELMSECLPAPSQHGSVCAK
jgi:hypothetical protein